MAAGLPSWSPCWAARSPCTPPKRFGRPDVLASQAMTPAPSSPHAIPAGVHVVSSRKEARQSDTRKSQPKPSWSDAQMREKSPSKRSPKMASPSTRPRAKSASCEPRRQERRRRPLHPPQRRAECVLDDEAVKGLQAENESLWQLAERLQMQLAAVEESQRRYQCAAEELLRGAWEEDAEEDQDELLQVLQGRHPSTYAEGLA
ncbi:unnamed protein product [Durusdinium trenchii]|uniref:Uncharacterized protein n=1 Tax=Durusdinium trenchii TaxID=1381693 RepID=A0ABP0S8P9_9DINO